MANDYKIAHGARNASKMVIEGIDEPKQDPMTGVTSPSKLLKSDTQRIDRNVLDATSPDYKKRPGAPEAIQKI